MDRTPIESSNIASIGWEDDTLQIEFVNGRVYNYFNVPRERYSDILQMPVSAGWYFDKFIKHYYKYEEVVVAGEEEE